MAEDTVARRITQADGCPECIAVCLCHQRTADDSTDRHATRQPLTGAQHGPRPAQGKRDNWSTGRYGGLKCSKME